MTQDEGERLLRYYRSYYLLRNPDGSWMSGEGRHKVMDDDSIRFAAEEFGVANSKALIGSAYRKTRREQEATR